MRGMQSRRTSELVDPSNDFGALRAGVAEGAGLAHDAGNLLGALTLYSELLAMPGVLHEEYRSFAGELRLLSDRSWSMISRLVNYAKVEIEQDATESEGTVLPEAVERCRGLLSRVAGWPIEVFYGAGAYERVNMGAEAAERILTNLVKNAAEAMAGAGSIAVVVEGALDGTRRRVTMTVRDRGCGMSAAAVERLMTGGISSVSGRGIGFCVVRELVAMSGGRLKVLSKVGQGTSIVVEWYAAEAVAHVAAHAGVRPDDGLSWNRRSTERGSIKEG